MPHRHYPKCQATAAAEWMEARQAELLPVEYYHVVSTLPAALGLIALQNQREVNGRGPGDREPAAERAGSDTS